MKKCRIFVVVFLFTAVSFSQALAADFLQLSLFNPVQLSNEDNDISGLRLNLIYTENQNVKGLDLGLINVTEQDFTGLALSPVHITKGNAKGVLLSYSGISIVKGDLSGIQLSSFFSRTAGDLTGLQYGVVNNIGGDIKGVQLGFVNIAQAGKGLQLGVVNIGKEISGVQIGIANILPANRYLKFFPFVNARF